MKYVAHLFVDAFTLPTSAETSKSRGEKPIREIVSCPVSAIGQYRKYRAGHSRSTKRSRLHLRAPIRDPDTLAGGGCPCLARQNFPGRHGWSPVRSDLSNAMSRERSDDERRRYTHKYCHGRPGK